jgi:hypothetical protein
LAVVRGSITWDCTAGPAPTNDPRADPTDETEPLQGWFTLHGIVNVDREAPGATFPFPGQASGLCSRQFELRTGAIETVVPWVHGLRARLVLIPERTRATLTIDLANGSVPETATAEAVVVERGTMRTLTAEFNLRAGRLRLEVWWDCSQRFEMPPLY